MLGHDDLQQWGLAIQRSHASTSLTLSVQNTLFLTVITISAEQVTDIKKTTVNKPELKRDIISTLATASLCWLEEHI